MTPSKPNQGKPVSSNSSNGEIRFDTLNPDKNIPAGIPDPMVISRMANEFFTSMPGLAEIEEGRLPSTAQDMYVREVGSLDIPGDLARDFQAPGAAILSQADLNALPASLGEPSWPAHPSVELGAPVWIPGAPADLSAMTSSEPASFSFIQDARPLFGSVYHPVKRVGPSSAVPEGFSQNSPLPNGIPPVPDRNVFAGSVPGSIPANLPAVPGSVQRFPAADTRASLPFLEDIRRLGPIDVIPVVEPIGS